MARWKAHGRLSIRILIELSPFCYSSGDIKRNVCSWAVFAGVDLFALKFYLDRVVPQQPFLASENWRHWATRRRRLHPLRSLVLTQYRSVLADRQTDGRICRSTYIACKVGFAERCKIVRNDETLSAKSQRILLSNKQDLAFGYCVMNLRTYQHIAVRYLRLKNNKYVSK